MFLRTVSIILSSCQYDCGEFNIYISSPSTSYLPSSWFIDGCKQTNVYLMRETHNLHVALNWYKLYIFTQEIWRRAKWSLFPLYLKGNVHKYILIHLLALFWIELVFIYLATSVKSLFTCYLHIEPRLIWLLLWLLDINHAYSPTSRRHKKQRYRYHLCSLTFLSILSNKSNDDGNMFTQKIKIRSIIMYYTLKHPYSQIYTIKHGITLANK